MKSSCTSGWESKTSPKRSRELRVGDEALITNSTRELVEFYWSNRKRFSGGYDGFPAKTNLQVNKLD